MFQMIHERIMPIFSFEQARRMGRAGLRQACLVVLAGLVVQLALGMVLNLYVVIPAADGRVSYLREMETAPGVLTAHALVALLVLATAGILLLRAVALRDRAVIALVTTGLAALLGAFAAGEVFVRNGTNGASLSMAILTGIALLCYVSLQEVIFRQRPQAQEAQAQEAQAQVPRAREPQAQEPRAREERRLHGAGLELRGCNGKPAGDSCSLPPAGRTAARCRRT